MKKLSKLFVSVFASIILSLTSAWALISIPDVETLQKDDKIHSLVSEISEKYKNSSSEEQSKLKLQIAQICGNLLCKYGVKSVARFVVPLAVAFDRETKKLNLELLEKIDWFNFLIVNDFSMKKLRLVLSGKVPIIESPLIEKMFVDSPSIKLLPSNSPIFGSSSVNLTLLI